MAKSETERLLDAVIQHRAALEGYSNATIIEINKLVREASVEIEKVIRAKFGSGEIDMGTWAGRRLAALRAEYAKIITATSSIIYRRLGDSLGYQAEYEARWIVAATRGALRASQGLQVLSADKVAAIVTEKPFNGLVLKKHVEKWAAGSILRLDKALRLGLLEGMSVEGILMRLVWSGGAFYRDGAMPVSERIMRMIVRTAVTHVNASVIQATLARHPEVYTGVLWVSVLDERTSLICKGLDGQVFPVDDGPRPPAHPNCRSTILPVLKFGRAPRVKTYETWLREQDEAVQREVLGPTRFALWKKGSMKLRDFVVGTEPLTIAELKKRDIEAFRRAGLLHDEEFAAGA